MSVLNEDMYDLCELVYLVLILFGNGYMCYVHFTYVSKTTDRKWL